MVDNRVQTNIPNNSSIFYNFNVLKENTTNFKFEGNILSNNNIKLTVWSLVNKTTLRISLPKFARKGLSFTSKGNFMALALRTSTQDSIGVYFLGNWSQISKFDVASNDLQDLKWSYDNSSILAE